MSFLQVNCGKKKNQMTEILTIEMKKKKKKKKKNQRTEMKKTQKVSFTF